MLSDPALTPFEPPAEPLRGFSAPWRLLRNYIETFPRSTYETGITHYRTRFSEVLLISEPEVIEDLLVRRSDEFGRDPVTKRAFKPFIGPTSLFMAEGAEWRWQRRAVAPAFRHETLLSFVPTFAAMAERQIERWRNGPGPSEVDADEAMTRTTFESIVATMLGGSARLEHERYSRAVTNIAATIPWQIALEMFAAPEWVPFPGRRRSLAANAMLQNDVGSIIVDRRGRAPERPDLLDLLMAARDSETGRGMTDLELINDLLTFLTAGHETTAVTLAWTLWLLAKDQTAQQDIRSEVAEVANGHAIGAEHVDRLTFTRQVVQEGLRLFPPAPALFRQAKHATTLGGIDVTPATKIIVPVFALHRHVKLWRDPHAFDPSRFSPEESRGRPRCAYLPFAAGPRICVGASFSMIEAVVVLASLVRAFRFTPVANYTPRPVARLSLRPHAGMPLMAEAI